METEEARKRRLERGHEYYIKHKERLKILSKNWSANNIDRVKENGEKYRKLHQKELSKYGKEWRKKHQDYTKEYNMNYWEENHDSIVKKANEYRKAHPEKIKPGLKRWYNKNPEKAKAHRLLYSAIKKGEIKRESCVLCGANKTCGHHDDYSKPFIVMFLCVKHHMLLHKSKEKFDVMMAAISSRAA